MQILYYLKWPLVVFLAGAAARIAGALMKILHWRGADDILVIATGIMVVAIIWLIIKLIIIKKNGG